MKIICLTIINEKNKKDFNSLFLFLFLTFKHNINKVDKKQN